MMPAADRDRALLSSVDIAVLAGGLGTRLAGILGDLPKIMAPIGGRPFLDYLLGWLAGQGAKRVLLCLGYRATPVLAHLETHPFPSLEIAAVKEPRPLGTAGALAFALSSLKSDPVMVMNGDTFVDADLPAFLASHRAAGAAASMVCALVDDPERYGRLDIDEHDRVVRFREKDVTAATPSWINAGLYLFNRTVLENVAKLEVGSLEHDVLELLPAGSLHAFKTTGQFLDIGTSESLAQAACILPSCAVHAREAPTS